MVNAVSYYSSARAIITIIISRIAGCFRYYYYSEGIASWQTITTGYLKMLGIINMFEITNLERNFMLNLSFAGPSTAGCPHFTRMRRKN